MFLSSSRFSFVNELEQHWQSVRDECMALPLNEFDPWPEKSLCRHGWDVYGLVLASRFILANCIFCPATTGLLRRIPGVVNAGFSRLAAGAVITPHVGYSNEVLRLHLGLLVQAPSGIRVGQQVQTWVPGKCLIFDDTVEHEAWNRSDSDRLLLLLDFVKPQGWSHHDTN